MSTTLSSLSGPNFLKMLAHDIRWNILTLLARSDYRGQELVKKLHHPQNLISYHLRQLSEYNLVSERRSTADARDIYYSLNVAVLCNQYAAAAGALHPALGKINQDPFGGNKRPNEKPVRVLFLCTKNSARSQMAEGILRHLSGDAVEVLSAGTQPATLHPFAIQVLATMGIAIAQQQSKHLDSVCDQTFDYIITVCDRVRESCPTFPGDREQIHWSLPDPTEAGTTEQERYQAFEQIAHQLMTRIQNLLLLIEQEQYATQRLSS